MERRVILILILSITAILSLIALVTGAYGYVTVSLFGFPVLFYTQQNVLSKIQWVVMITLLLIITVASVNLLANLTGNLMYYYEFLSSLLITIITLSWSPDKVEIKG
nr:hypothetical protein [uncultured Carboxylicivirga sp.]